MEKNKKLFFLLEGNKAVPSSVDAMRLPSDDAINAVSENMIEPEHGEQGLVYEIPLSEQALESIHDDADAALAPGVLQQTIAEDTHSAEPEVLLSGLENPGATVLNDLITGDEAAEEEQADEDKAADGGGGSSWVMFAIGLSALGALGAGVFLLKSKDDDKDNDNQESIIDTKEEEVGIQGVVTLGPTVDSNGLVAEIYAVDGTLLATDKVSSQGVYQAVVAQGHTHFKVVIRDTDNRPDYRDEATGELKDLEGNLFTVITVDSEKQLQTAHVNPVTTLASRMMGLDVDGNGDFPTPEKISDAYMQVAKNLFGDASLDIASYDVVPVMSADGTVVNGNEGGNLLALISALENTNGVTTDAAIELLLDASATNEQGQVEGLELRELLKNNAESLEGQFGEKFTALVDAQFTKAEIISLDKPIVRENLPPEGENNIILLGEDKTHVFTEADFGFSDLNENDALSSIRLHRLPAKGYLRLDGEELLEPRTIEREDLSKLSYKGRADEHGTSYSVLTFSVSDGVLESDQQSIIFDVSSINDAPTLEIEESFDSLFGEIKKINTNSEGDQYDPDLIALDDGAFIAVWIDNEKSIKAQKYKYQETFAGDLTLVKDSDEFTINSSETAENQRLYNPEIAADDHGDFAIQWWKYEQGSTTESFVGFFDENNGVIGEGEQQLGLQYLTKSIISMNNGLQAVGYIAVGYVQGGDGGHFGVNIYDDGVFVRNVKITDVPGFGTNDLVLTPLSIGGFAGTFRISSQEVNQIGFAFFDHEGRLKPESLIMQDSDLGADEELEMVELIDGTLIIFNREGTDLILQGWQNQLPIFSDVVVNEQDALSAENVQVIALDDGGFFTLWTLVDDSKGDAIIGRYYDAQGNALTSEIEIFHLEPGFSFGGASVDQLENGRLQLAWSDDKDGSEDIYMSTLNLDKLQHNLSDNVTVGQASSEDVEGSDITFSLKNDANGLFQVDPETGVISVKDPAGVAASDNTSFMIKVQVNDEEGEAFDLEHQVKFPGSVKEAVEDTKFVLTDQEIDVTELGDINELTLGYLIELGILKPAELGITAGPGFQGSAEYQAFVDGYTPETDYGYLSSVIELIG